MVEVLAEEVILPSELLHLFRSFDCGPVDSGGGTGLLVAMAFELSERSFQPLLGEPVKFWWHLDRWSDCLVISSYLKSLVLLINYKVDLLPPL